MLELYEAFSDYTDTMRLTEELIAEAARLSVGANRSWSGTAGPSISRRRSCVRPMIDLVQEHAGVSVHPSDPVEDLRKICDDLEIPYEQHSGSGKLVLEIYEKTTRSRRSSIRRSCATSPLEVAHRSPVRIVTTRRSPSGSS